MARPGWPPASPRAPNRPSPSRHGCVPAGPTPGSISAKNFDATLARVLEFVDLPPDPACARFYESDSQVRTVSRAQVKQPVNGRGRGRWRPYAQGLAPLIEELERAGALENWREGDGARPNATPDPGDALPVSPAEGLLQ